MANKQPVTKRKRSNTNQPSGKNLNQGFLVKNKELLLLAVVVVITIFIYAPALHNKFTTWDDREYVTENPYILAFTHDNLAHIFTKPIANNYHPLTMLTLALNYHVSGMEPFSYFLVNIILHLFNIILTYYLAYLILGKNKLQALFVAAIFAVHPMHVESVAWISERKDVLYSAFFLSGLISWILFLDKRNWSWYIFAFFLFALAGLSKPSSVVFPLVLLLIDYLNKRKFDMMLITEKIPFFLVSAAIGIATLNAQIGNALVGTVNYNIIQRLLFASYGLFFYIFKLFIPAGLSALHPFPLLHHSMSMPWPFFISPVCNLIVLGLVLYSLKYTRYIAFAFLFYLVNIMLTLQFMQVGSAVVAERYSYISYIGLLIGVAWLINRATEKKRFPAAYMHAGCLLFFGLMTFVAFHRVPVWKNNETLWTDVLEQYPDSFSAYNSRGFYYLNEKMLDKALPDFTRALELQPSSLEVLSNRGSIYRMQNLPRLAIDDYNRALTIDPNYLLAISGRGNAYFTLGLLDSALTDFNRALAINPSMAIAHGNRGAVLYRMGLTERAVEDYSSGIAIDPNYTDAYLNRGVGYSTLQKWDLAISDYTLVLKTITSNPLVYQWRGIAYRSKGEYKAAINDFTEGIRLNPGSAALYMDRSMAYQQAGMAAKANEDMNAARKLGAKVQ
ncbi:MAG: tetratricopeptide repeat protein [Bacteroidota bacterium]